MSTITAWLGTKSVLNHYYWIYWYGLHIVCLPVNLIPFLLYQQLSHLSLHLSYSSISSSLPSQARVIPENHEGQNCFTVSLPLSSISIPSFSLRKTIFIFLSFSLISNWLHTDRFPFVSKRLSSSSWSFLILSGQKVGGKRLPLKFRAGFWHSILCPPMAWGRLHHGVHLCPTTRTALALFCLKVRTWQAPFCRAALQGCFLASMHWWP